MARKDTVTMTVRFPVDLHARLQQIAENEHRTFSGAVLYAVQRYVEEWERERATDT
jgi:predicted transcriptional regulator